METNPSNSKKNQPEVNDTKAYARYAGIVVQMGVIIGIGAWGGVKLDKVFEMQKPVFTIILSLLSVVTALYIALKDFIKK